MDTHCKADLESQYTTRVRGAAYGMPSRKSRMAYRSDNVDEVRCDRQYPREIDSAGKKKDNVEASARGGSIREHGCALRISTLHEVQRELS